jgi:hypothetical protein
MKKSQRRLGWALQSLSRSRTSRMGRLQEAAMRELRVQGNGEHAGIRSRTTRGREEVEWHCYAYALSRGVAFAGILRVKRKGSGGGWGGSI